MSFVVPSEVFDASHFTEEEFLIEIILMLFREKRITIGKASSLLGMHLIQFQQLISIRNISIHYDVEDLNTDIQTLSELELLYIGQSR